MNLNNNQISAVESEAKSLLVLAGAGSGKTRVLTMRVAWLIQNRMLHPDSVLAVTFTNKAASELRTRLATLLEGAEKHLWVGTFHSMAHRMLRAHNSEAFLPNNFQILDADDQRRLMRRLLRDLQIPEDDLQPQEMTSWIEGKKNNSIHAVDIPSTDDILESYKIRVYRAYEEYCEEKGIVDFTDLLLKTVELLRNNSDIRQAYQSRFKHLLVDEFQDTNKLQYEWLMLIRGEETGLTVVGDDDQAIYGWRHADVSHMQKIRSLPGAVVCRLEQNYRSTANILNAANTLINHNRNRLGKTLWTSSGDGELIDLYQAYDEFDEARNVASELQKWQKQGNRLSDAAVLYRSNAQSRVLEEELITKGIPYIIYGGTRYYERAEIKDCLAYLRLAMTPQDDLSLTRVINVPSRRIGNRTVSMIAEHSVQNNCSMWESASHFACQAGNRNAKPIAKFMQLMTSLREELVDKPLEAKISIVLERSELREHHGKKPGEEGISKVENLNELIDAGAVFESEWEKGNISVQGEDDLQDATEAFLASAALEKEHGETELQDSVQLITLHSAKGLEFKFVQIVGLEYQLFPHIHAKGGEQIEEERRLCYVGMTRAMEKLRLTWASYRMQFGTPSQRRPSSFLTEIQDKYLVDQSFRDSGRKGSRMAPEGKILRQLNKPVVISAFDVGQKVNHKMFGEGIVTATDSSTSGGKVQVNFVSSGSKWLVVEYANLQQL